LTKRLPTCCDPAACLICQGRDEAMPSDPAKKPEGEHDPKLDPQAPIWSWMGKTPPRREPVMPSLPQPTSPEPRPWSDRTREWKRDAPSLAERRAKSVLDRSFKSPDYAILDALRVICLISAALSPLIGVLVYLESVNGYHILIGLLSGASLLLMAAWIGLAIDIAKHAKQAAGELKELRLLLAKQLEPPNRPESAKV
jgi:hypothetical protein